MLAPEQPEFPWVLYTGNIDLILIQLYWFLVKFKKHSTGFPEWWIHHKTSGLSLEGSWGRYAVLWERMRVPEMILKNQLTTQGINHQRGSGNIGVLNITIHGPTHLQWAIPIATFLCSMGHQISSSVMQQSERVCVLTGIFIILSILVSEPRYTWWDYTMIFSQRP